MISSVPYPTSYNEVHPRLVLQPIYLLGFLGTVLTMETVLMAILNSQITRSMVYATPKMPTKSTAESLNGSSSLGKNNHLRSAPFR
ncbi:hypothetical protein BDM02DRAFT_3109041 [Thelephora ganbajun]|uniref:Uncharacterized protein n=1 Tax=Thelephora ganbajun TaxID=370292 RepID=A0ACB6ZST0_THEGA|nr:hypothetical protein BDM02DRAFT_3109041 [Thelephora ganbajun]